MTTASTGKGMPSRRYRAYSSPPQRDHLGEREDQKPGQVQGGTLLRLTPDHQNRQAEADGIGEEVEGSQGEACIGAAHLEQGRSTVEEDSQGGDGSLGDHEQQDEQNPGHETVSQFRAVQQAGNSPQIDNAHRQLQGI